ncbi:hypothetical protein SCLARK_001101 [Spiroplasma clarkii]|uniref:Uncharacterized protein n=1 Tax=Spiroplasma clarkii TaxID=2139 RepID=A0A1Y0L1L5_9MOLU|nr:hypothetical protein [Spiroplasma clarkii]ARU91670.1 hypothetical protein SCLARK_001101 [Spiroplasma clarkii]ATX71061.1 hypothetical protein SCLAR_v1c07440 [Spiroplasma clarkii]
MKKLLVLLGISGLTFVNLSNVVSCSAPTASHESTPSEPDPSEKLLDINEFLGDIHEIMMNNEDERLLDEEGKFSDELAIQLFINNISKIKPEFNPDLFNFSIDAPDLFYNLKIKPKKDNRMFDHSIEADVFILLIRRKPFVPPGSTNLWDWEFFRDWTNYFLIKGVKFLKTNFIDTNIFGKDTILFQEYARMQVQYQMLRLILAKIEESNQNDSENIVTEGVEVEENKINELVTSLQKMIWEETFNDIKKFKDFAICYAIS